MIPQTIVSAFLPIREWESAGASLAASLDKYLELSTNLGSRSMQAGVHPQNLTNRIDSALQSLHLVLDRKLARARSTLAKTRNERVSRLYGLPREILSAIFLNVVYTPVAPHTTPMANSLLRMFPDLYSMQRVCRVWREIIVSRGAFWYVAPVYHSGVAALKCTRGPGLSLQRSKDGLYLAAVMDVDHFRELHLFHEDFNISRILKVNVEARYYFTISQVIQTIVRYGPPFSLSELSMHEKRTDSLEHAHQQGSIRTLSSNSEGWGGFCELLKSLTVLRIRGVHFSWDHMQFSDRLVELRLQEVVVGCDSMLIEFLDKLSSASELRDLKIISVRTTRDEAALIRTPRQIRFPHLESLYLEDLFYNTLESIFRHIAPGPHCLTLFLTDKSTEINRREAQHISIYDLCSVLNTVSVDTLLLLGEWNQEWLTPPDLCSILCSMPGLKTLKMSGWAFAEEQWRAITRIQTEHSGATAGHFPQLEYLHLSSVHVQVEERLKSVVTSHSLQRMVLGGSICTGPNTMFDFDPFEGDEPILDWLRSNVPEFRLVDDSTDPPEFSSAIWQLW